MQYQNLKLFFDVDDKLKIINLITILSNTMTDFDDYRIVLNEFYNHFDDDCYMIIIDE